MRIFVYEHISGGGLAEQPLPDELARAGDAMLHALLADLHAAGVDLLTSRDHRLPPLPDYGQQLSVVTTQADWQTLWQRLPSLVDAVWPIAPESDNILGRLSERILAADLELFGSTPAAVRLAGSKYATYTRLAAAGLPTPISWRLTETASPAPPWVVKPDDGAGCEDTRILRSAATVAEFRRTCSQPQRYIVQPLIPGEAVSLSLLCDLHTTEVVGVNRQIIAMCDDVLSFQGVIAGAYAPNRVWRELAVSVRQAIPGLWGYVGVDCIISDTGPVILEINPRLTMSYIGLHDRIGRNPAALLLAAMAQ